ncbi:dockerin type I domain-containing protein [Halococcoides cellulosivorans]|uniref:dockerin type I domain-containing protein n=1 Tax=Halococcoides cellulosivorans TaxID=1679096 RepID=UPI00131F1136|nr:dockerin type I domain-containing protein [Halococcoides cellulosivorans]
MEVEDPDVVEISGLEPPGDLTAQPTIEDGRRATLSVFQEPWFGYIGVEPPLATLTLQGKTAGRSTDVTLEISYLGDDCIVEDDRRTIRVADERPDPPTTLDYRPNRGDSVLVSWDHPADGCDSVVDEYVVSIDGTDENTVPVGVTEANVFSKADVTAGEIGVRAVDTSTGASDTVTTAANWSHDDPDCVVEIAEIHHPVPVDDTIPISVLWEDFGSLPDLESVTVAVSNPCVATITDGDVRQDIEGSVTVDDRTATITVDESVPDADSTGTLGWVTVAGQRAGFTGIEVVDVSMATESTVLTNGDMMSVYHDLSEYVDAAPTIDGARPTDPDDDGLYEDLTGDGRVNFPDVNTLFQHTDESVVQNNVELFDYNDDGNVNDIDVLALFESV